MAKNGSCASLYPVPGRPIVVGVHAVMHLLALLVFVPYFFSWTGVWLAVLGSILSVVGINICYHRMLAHRGLSCSKRVEHCLALLGVLTDQFGPAYWVAIHRRHHQDSDGQRDPHSPRSGLYWSHIGWLFTSSENTDQRAIMERYAKDLLADPFYAWLETEGRWGQIAAASWLVYFAAGVLFSLATGGSLASALQFGASLLVWGVIFRTVCVWHFTFSVNSICHRWGYRTHETPDDSRNNPIVALLAWGEGWHNNHHAFPRSARHGHRWWEIDLSWLIIRTMEALRLVKVLDRGEAAIDGSRVRRERPTI